MNTEREVANLRLGDGRTRLARLNSSCVMLVSVLSDECRERDDVKLKRICRSWVGEERVLYSERVRKRNWSTGKQLKADVVGSQAQEHQNMIQKWVGEGLPLLTEKQNDSLCAGWVTKCCLFRKEVVNNRRGKE